jgi:pseudaminic acid synthase
VNIGGVEIGGGQPCRVIAELSCNHGGSLDRALRMIRAAKEAKCDLVKFQAYTPTELIALRGDGPAPGAWGEQGYTMQTLYEEARTPFGWFPTLFAYAREIGITPFASFFGRESFDVLQSVNCGAYKIAALDRTHSWIVDLAISSGKPVIASVPTEADRRERGVEYLLCPPDYPQTAIALDRRMFVEQFVGIAGTVPPPFIGFSYHGRDHRVCYDAAVLGAGLIEAHFQLENEMGSIEWEISLTNVQFAQLVKEIRASERRVTRAV